MVGGAVLQLSSAPTSAGRRHYPPLVCALTKQGERFLSSIATSEEPSTAASLLRKFVASSSKHGALTTLSHLISHHRLSTLAFPLYSVIEKESWFKWNAKLMADLIALSYKLGNFDEAERLFSETVSKLGKKERDLCMFYCNLLDSHAKNKSEKGFLDICTRLNDVALESSSIYVKQKGYESIVRGFCELGMPKEAEDSIREMTEMGLKVSTFEFRSLVYSYGQTGFLENMKRSVLRMENEGFEVDTVCYNMVLSSFGAHNELSDMIIWLKKMRVSGIRFSIRTYNSVLNSCPNIMLLLEDLKKLPLSVNELMDNLNENESGLVQELLKSNVLDEVMEWKSSELKLDLHGMHLSTAYIILLQWFDELEVLFADESCSTPAEILVVCGLGKHSSTRGESPVRSLAKEMIMMMKCPLRIDRKNIGCFICKGKGFREWICHERVNKVPSLSMGVSHVLQVAKVEC